jgi:membrane protease YdiL (CAAX protease family)
VNVVAATAPAGLLLAFFLCTYIVTWACFLSVVASGLSPRTFVGAGLLLFGTITPSLIAIGLTAWSEGQTGVERLLCRVVRWQVTLRWYLFAAGYVAAIKLTVAVVYRLASGLWPHFGAVPWYQMAIVTIFSTPVQAGEEIGWRGFALPRLAYHLGFAWAGIVLGVIWAVWHLPLFFIPEAETYGQSFVVYVLQVTAVSVAMAWLYMRTRGSLLLVMLMHAAANNTKNIVPSAVPNAADTFGLRGSAVAWLTVGLLWIFAAYFLVRMKGNTQTDAVAEN